MGIIEDELSTTVLSDGTEVTIEYNAGDIIHVHIGRFRLDLSPEEFKEFSAAIREGKVDLLEVKNGLQSA